jgi:hypothetical protein
LRKALQRIIYDIGSYVFMGLKADDISTIENRCFNQCISNIYNQIHAAGHLKAVAKVVIFLPERLIISELLTMLIV